MKLIIHYLFIQEVLSIGLLTPKVAYYSNSKNNRHGTFEIID